jgi:hypothetical protein
MPLSFAQFDTVVDHEYARECRYTSRNIERGLEEKLASSVSTLPVPITV